MMAETDHKAEAERLAKLKRKATKELAMIADATAHNIMVVCSPKPNNMDVVSDIATLASELDRAKVPHV